MSDKNHSSSPCQTCEEKFPNTNQYTETHYSLPESLLSNLRSGYDIGYSEECVGVDQCRESIIEALKQK